MRTMDRLMCIEEAIVRGFDSTELFVRRVTAATDDHRRTLVLVHGMCEHGGRYEHIAHWFGERGWNVLLPDLRGHGRSGGVRTHVARFEEYSQDLDRLWEHFDLQPQQTAVMGHSMGALAGARYLQTRGERAAAIVLLSPLLRVSVHIDPFTLAVGRLLSVAAPRFRFRSRVNTDHTTRNQEALQRRLCDELMQKSVTARWYFAMQAARRAAWLDAGNLHVPTLVLQAGDDLIVDPVAPEEWLQRTASPDREFRAFDGLYHELHNESAWPEVMSIAADWLEPRVTTDNGFDPQSAACGLAVHAKSPTR